MSDEEIGKEIGDEGFVAPETGGYQYDLRKELLGGSADKTAEEALGEIESYDREITEELTSTTEEFKTVESRKMSLESGKRMIERKKRFIEAKEKGFTDLEAIITALRSDSGEADISLPVVRGLASLREEQGDIQRYGVALRKELAEYIKSKIKPEDRFVEIHYESGNLFAGDFKDKGEGLVKMTFGVRRQTENTYPDDNPYSKYSRGSRYAHVDIKTENISGHIEADGKWALDVLRDADVLRKNKFLDADGINEKEVASGSKWKRDYPYSL